MSAAAHGGLSGKARHLHYRTRAQRLYAQQLINDYMGLATDADPPERYIPIRGRSEFLPAIAQASLRAPRPSHVQLELPLHGAEHDAPLTDSRESAPVSVMLVATNSRAGEPTDGRTASTTATDLPKDKVIRFARSTGTDAVLPFKPPEQLDRMKRRPFTVAGFLAGCAMGSAAAAVVLLLVRTVVG